MDQRYFERLHAEEAQHMQWQLLDEALHQRTSRKTITRRLRIVIGRMMIETGRYVAGGTLDR
jgi:hypothetical protein